MNVFSSRARIRDGLLTSPSGCGKLAEPPLDCVDGKFVSIFQLYGDDAKPEAGPDADAASAPDAVDRGASIDGQLGLEPSRNARGSLSKLPSATHVSVKPLPERTREEVELSIPFSL